MAKGARHHSIVRHLSLSLAPPATAPERTEARLAALISDHFDFIWRLLRRSGLSPADADDAAQQVFMIATQKLDNIAAGAERSFLYGTALRVAANMRRATQRREVEQPLLETEPSEAESPEGRAELGQALSLLDELFAALPPELGRVLALAEVEELEVKEIALLESIPVGTAASRLRRARERFQELLAAAGPRNPFGGCDDS